jgi:hypothetical protein
MPDQVEIKSSSKESVALTLAQDIATQESLHNDKATYREKFLDLYAECLKATKGNRRIPES